MLLRLGIFFSLAAIISHSASIQQLNTCLRQPNSIDHQPAMDYKSTSPAPHCPLPLQTVTTQAHTPCSPEQRCALRAPPAWLGQLPPAPTLKPHPQCRRPTRSQPTTHRWARISPRALWRESRRVLCRPRADRILGPKTSRRESWP